MAMTEDMVRDLFAQRAKPGATLVTIEAADLADPIRVTDWPGGLTVPAEPDDLVFQYAPFRLSWGGAGRGDASRKPRLEIAALGEAVELIRATGGEVSATMELVRVVAPGVAEKAVRGALLAEAEVAGGAITVTFGSRRDYGNEPACKARYTLSRTPGLS